jgi:putative sigma-54 modulation protein
MPVEWTGRNVEVTPSLKDLAEERTQRLERRLGGPASVRVVLSHERHRFGAEVIATHRRRRWTAQERTADVRAALALAFEKIDAQAKRDSEKRRDRRHRAAPPSWRVQIFSGDSLGRSAASDNGGGGGGRVVRTDRLPIKPMSIEEAAFSIEDSNREFLVFRDSGNDKISVLYKRRDGDFGLIVPEC